MGRLDNKTALITGGGSGIGRATSMLFALEGADVILSDIDENQGQEVVNEIQKSGGKAQFVSQNVAKEEDWQRVLQEIYNHQKLPKILINNAGLLLYKELENTTIEDWYKLMDVNALGVFLGMKHCAPAMAKEGGGSIVNLSSTAGLVGVARQTLYGASKGAVRTMTKDAAIELAPKKVRVNSIHPSIVDTQMADYGAEERHKSKE
ncbi:cyclopentanol dehydrogenase [Lyngbya aestuarii BL J]|uniref:Cyclopentanol dehydrogenase n=1 Tax=Lyngbya aestuarii BL J TaxID=1348334 RepID=U7QQR6_9CYAN|nr:cyclopentanol dehydrogenase [Lyngbya aestuarii BL J]